MFALPCGMGDRTGEEGITTGVICKDSSDGVSMPVPDLDLYFDFFLLLFFFFFSFFLRDRWVVIVTSSVCSDASSF